MTTRTSAPRAHEGFMVGDEGCATAAMLPERRVPVKRAELVPPTREHFVWLEGPYSMCLNWHSTLFDEEAHQIGPTPPSVQSRPRRRLSLSPVERIEATPGRALPWPLARPARRSWVRAPVRAILIVPMVLPPVVVALIWKILFTPDISILDWSLGLLGLPQPAWLADPKLALWAVIVADVWEWFPFVMLMLLAALQMLPSDPLEAARLDGASRWQVFRYVTVPLLKPAIVVATLFRLIDSVKAFPHIFIMTGGGPGTTTEVTNFYAYLQGFSYTYVGYSSAIIVVMLLATFGMTRGVRFLAGARARAGARLPVDPDHAHGAPHCLRHPVLPDLQGSGAHRHADRARRHLPHVQPFPRDLDDAGVLRRRPPLAGGSGLHRRRRRHRGLSQDRPAPVGARPRHHRDLHLPSGVDRRLLLAAAHAQPSGD